MRTKHSKIRELSCSSNIIALREVELKRLCISAAPAALSDNHNVGNGCADRGGGNSRSSSAKSFFVRRTLSDSALSRTCASSLAFGMAMTPVCRNTQARAIGAEVAPVRRSYFLSQCRQVRRRNNCEREPASISNCFDGYFKDLSSIERGE
jgi:hypothetical protein